MLEWCVGVCVCGGGLETHRCEEVVVCARPKRQRQAGDSKAKHGVVDVETILSMNQAWYEYEISVSHFQFPEISQP